MGYTTDLAFGSSFGEVHGPVGWSNFYKRIG